MANNQNIKSASCCYVFKSRLQEYTQKVGLPTPVYETIKEGPAHEPTFMSTVIVDNVRYDSLPGFYNRKAAEQSAAEVALMKLGNAGSMQNLRKAAEQSAAEVAVLRLGNAGSMQNLSQPVHETGLCKNLLQEYAQKMNFAIPQYECRRYDTESKMITFSCTVDVGGMKYTGAAARTKKEAEIKAARTALLAVQSSGLGPNYSGYTVVPMKKVTDLAISNQESAAALKPKKSKFKKKQKRNVSDASNQVRTMNTGDSQVQMVNQAKPELHDVRPAITKVYSRRKKSDKAEVENALKRNFNSYGAWHHHKWVLSKGHSSTDRELLLLGKFQKVDACNLHAWKYRRFSPTLKNIPNEKELEYTTYMIYDNFSNYSAWHNRRYGDIYYYFFLVHSR